MKVKMIASLITVLLISSMASNVNASSPANFVQTWTFPVQGGFNVGDMALAQGVVAIEQSQFGPPAIDNETSYGLDSRTGTLLWSTQDFVIVGNSFSSNAGNSFISPGQTNGELFFAVNLGLSFYDCSTPYRVLAIDPRSGHVVWSVDAPCHSSGPFVAGDTVVVYRYNEALAAYDASTGNLKWLLPEKGVPYFGTPVAYGSGILLLAGLIALNASSGAQIWTRPIFDSFDCSSVVNGTVFGEQFHVNYTSAGSITGLSTISVIALDGNDGSTLWNKTYPYVNSDGSGCPAVQNGLIFFMSYPVSDATAQVIALSTSDGSEQWRRTLPCMNGCSVYLNGAAAGDGLLFVSNGLQYTDTEYNDTMYAFDTISGSTMWQHTLPGASYVRMIYDNGTLYTSADGWIAAFSNRGVSMPEFPSTLALVTFAVAVLGVRLMMKRREESQE